jgi:RNA polymerase sigma-70 factor, ECF subfamily
MTNAAEPFHRHASRLRALAYRMLGSHAESEDVVQDAWLRWNATDQAQVANAPAYLAQVVTRLCLDRAKSAAAQREHYVGPWLPEPVPDDSPWLHTDPADEAALADDVSYALVLALQRLSAAERAAFLLHDVFDLDFDAVAQTLGRTPAACRQLATRARRQVREARPRFTPTPADAERLLTAFQAAVIAGDVQGLAKLLTEDASFISDGGGKVSAPRKPVLGRERIAQGLIGLAHKHALPAGQRAQSAWLNGWPGFIVTGPDGEPVQTIVLELSDAGRVRTIYAVRNPDKLGALRAALARAPA